MATEPGLRTALRYLSDIGAGALLDDAGYTIPVRDNGELHPSSECPWLLDSTAEPRRVTGRQYLASAVCHVCDLDPELKGYLPGGRMYRLAWLAIEIGNGREALARARDEAGPGQSLPRTQALVEVYQSTAMLRRRLDSLTEDLKRAPVTAVLADLSTDLKTLAAEVSAATATRRWQQDLGTVICGELLPPGLDGYVLTVDTTPTFTVFLCDRDSIPWRASEVVDSYSRRSTQQAHLLVCPRFVTDWLLRFHATGAGSQQTSVLAYPVNDLDDAVVETAAGLWHLDEPSPLNSPAGCLAAARALHHTA